MPEKIGPHLLGRIPSKPDDRNYRLENFVGLGEATLDPAADAIDLIDAGLAELQKTTVSYKKWAATVYKDPTVTHWWQALNYFATAKQVLAPAPAPADSIWTNSEPTLDQGDYGTCVGNGEAQFGNTLPFDDKFDETDARAIYYEATILDGSPDDPDAKGGGQQGATVLSGEKAMKNRGRIASYALTTSLDTAKSWLATKGPIVVGSDWYYDMFYPNADNYITATGSYQGGHCYLLLGYHPSPDSFEFLNSWGASWGDNGHFFMKSADLAKLMKNGGEMWTAVELAL